jgi:hypothetical protein
LAGVSQHSIACSARPARREHCQHRKHRLIKSLNRSAKKLNPLRPSVCTGDFSRRPPAQQTSGRARGPLRVRLSHSSIHGVDRLHLRQQTFRVVSGSLEGPTSRSTECRSGGSLKGCPVKRRLKCTVMKLAASSGETRPTAPRRRPKQCGGNALAHSMPCSGSRRGDYRRPPPAACAWHH